MRVLVATALIAGCSYTPSAVTTTTDGSTDVPPMVSDGPSNGDAASIDAPQNQTIFACDGPEDCNAHQVCCNTGNGSSCRGACNNGLEVCHTAADCAASCSVCALSTDFGQQVCCE